MKKQQIWGRDRKFWRIGELGAKAKYLGHEHILRMKGARALALIGMDLRQRMGGGCLGQKLRAEKGFRLPGGVGQWNLVGEGVGGGFSRQWGPWI